MVRGSGRQHPCGRAERVSGTRSYDAVPAIRAALSRITSSTKRITACTGWDNRADRRATVAASPARAASAAPGPARRPHSDKEASPGPRRSARRPACRPLCDCATRPSRRSLRRRAARPTVPRELATATIEADHFVAAQIVAMARSRAGTRARHTATSPIRPTAERSVPGRGWDRCGSRGRHRRASSRPAGARQPLQR